MKKGWSIIITLVLVAILLGAVCVGVGLMTGGDISRVIAVLDERYHPDLYLDYIVQVAQAVREAVFAPVA